MELSPKDAAQEDCFLNVIQMSDRSTKKLLPVSRIQNVEAKTVGAIVGSRAVVFSADCGRSSEGYGFEIPASAAKTHKTKKFNLLISGLEKGEWVVERNGKSLGKFPAGEADGTIYLNAAPGKYLVRR